MSGQNSVVKYGLHYAVLKTKGELVSIQQDVDFEIDTYTVLYMYIRNFKKNISLEGIVDINIKIICY